MSTKANPGPYDCYSQAEQNEPVFTLMGRDRLSPSKVRTWARERAEDVALGIAPQSDALKVIEAYEIANAMEKFRKERVARMIANGAIKADNEPRFLVEATKAAASTTTVVDEPFKIEGRRHPGESLLDDVGKHAQKPLEE